MLFILLFPLLFVIEFIKLYFFLNFWLYMDFLILNKRTNFIFQPDFRKYNLKPFRIPKPPHASILYVHQFRFNIARLLRPRSFPLLFFFFLFNYFLEDVVLLVLHVAHWVVMVLSLLENYFGSFIIQVFKVVDEGSVFSSELHYFQLFS